VGRRRDFQEALMQDITPEEEQLIHQSINQDVKLPWGVSSQDLRKLQDGSINMNIIQIYLTRFLSHQDEKLCEKDPTRSKSVFYLHFLHNYYDASTDKYIYSNLRNYSKQNKAPGGDIFKTKYIFIPIHQRKHFTCAVIYMQDKQIMYYNLYLITDRTRTMCSHKKENQERILQALLEYLKDEHLNKNSIKLPNQDLWKLHS
jgi:Ulp1 family protease